MNSNVPENENDIFAGDKEFFKALKSSMKNSNYGRQDNFFSANVSKNSKNLSGFQILLLVIMTAIAAPLLYVTVFQNLTFKPQPQQQVQKVQNLPVSNQINNNNTNNTNNINEKLLSQIQSKDVPEPQAISLSLANNSFAQKNYPKALKSYEMLTQNLTVSQDNLLFKDFIEMRMAFCLYKLGHTDEAYKLLRILSTSHSPAIAAFANYNTALIEFERNLYLQARTCSYRAAALCQAIKANTDWALNLQRNCHLLTALSLTRKTMVMTDSDHDTPKGLWDINILLDPCNEMDEQELIAFLKSGTDIINQAAFGPKTKKASYNSDIEQYQVISKMSPVEELFARFAANTKINLTWKIEENSNELLKKSVTLYMNNVSIEEFSTTAAGCAGLKATIEYKNDKTKLIIENLSQYTELQNHLDMLTQTALDCWNTFVIKYHNDTKLDTAHYSMGTLYSIASRTNEAIAQYKMLSNRFGYSPLAKYALLESSKIKSDLHNYAGASQDLKQLLEQHHQSEVAQKACLYLADSSIETGLYQEAAKNYQKVYNFDYSIKSKSRAALGAAKSYYMNQKYVLAENWLNRFIRMSQGKESPELQYAYMLLGKTSLKAEKPEQAFNAFKRAISRNITPSDRKEIISALLKCDIDKLDPVQALEVTTKLQEKALSGEESIKVLLVRSRILRKIHLPDKALIALKERIEYITDANLKAQAYIETAEVLDDLDQHKIAKNYLSKALTLAEPPLNIDITLYLAKINLKLNQNEDAIDLCSNLIDQRISELQHEQAVEIIALAHQNQKDYEKALSSLLGIDKNEDDDQNPVLELDDTAQSLIKQEGLQES